MAGFLGGATFAASVIEIIGYKDPYAEIIYYTVQGWENPKLKSDPMVIYLKHRIKWCYDSRFKDEAKDLREIYYSKTTIRDV